MPQHAQDGPTDPQKAFSESDLPLIELETLLSRPPSRRKRLLRLGLVMVAGAVIVLLFSWSLLSDQPAVPAISASPASVFLLTSNVTGASVTINGKHQPGTLPMLVPLDTDMYTIRLDAPPFLPISCHIYVPGVMTGTEARLPTCFAFALPSGEPLALLGRVGVPVMQASLWFTAGDLPPAQQGQVTTLLTQALTWQQDMAVPVGSYVVTHFVPPASQTTQLTQVPLQASAVVAPFTPPDQGDGLPCAAFLCPHLLYPLTAPHLAARLWAVEVPVALSWRFRTSSGTALTQVSFQGISPTDRMTLFLSPSPAGEWTIASTAPAPASGPEPRALLCSTAERLLLAQVGSSSGVSVGVIQDDGPQGCLLRAQADGVDRGVFLWRFGVLLAVDEQAQAMAPQLPLAPSAEVDAVSG